MFKGYFSVVSNTDKHRLQVLTMQFFFSKSNFFCNFYLLFIYFAADATHCILLS